MTGVFGKLAADVALYQMYAALVMAFAFGEGPHGGGMFLLLAAALLLALSQKIPALRTGVRRVIPVAAAAGLLAAEFFSASSAVQKAAFAPPAVYLLAMGFARTWQADYEEQRGRFLAGFWGLVLLPVFALFGRSRFVPALFCILPWILVYLVCGVVQLRLLREARPGGRQLIRQLGELAVLFGVCLLLERTGAFALFLEGLSALWEEAVRPGITILLGGVLYVPLLLAEGLAGWLQSRMQTGGTQAEDALHGIRMELYEGMGDQMEQWQPISERTAAVWTAVLLAVCLFAVILFFRRLVGRGLRREQAVGVEEIREKLDAEAGGRRRRTTAREPGEAIRQLFGRYVALLRKKGLQPRDSDTSRRLADRGREAMPASADEIEQLRSLYLPARYRDGKSCSRGERREALRLWREIRRKAEAETREKG